MTFKTAMKNIRSLEINLTKIVQNLWRNYETLWKDITEDLNCKIYQVYRQKGPISEYFNSS